MPPKTWRKSSGRCNLNHFHERLVDKKMKTKTRKHKSNLLRISTLSALFVVAAAAVLVAASCGHSGVNADLASVSSSDVSAPEIPEDVSLSDLSIEIGKGITRSLEASGGKNITWKSSDDSIASVTSDGAVTGIDLGECDLIAQNEFGNSAKCHVVVKKTVYLTIDDGPLAYSDKILNKLKNHHVKATFFVVKTRRIENVKRMNDEGHLVALHTYSHKFETCYRSDKSYFADLQKLSDIVEEYTGKRTNIIRFPGGTSNQKAYILNMRRMISGLHDLGYRAFDWTCSSGDASYPPITYMQSAWNVLGSCYKDVEIVLMHDRSMTPKALDIIIPELKERGYVFETLDHYPEKSFRYPSVYEKYNGDKTVPCEELKLNSETCELKIGKTLTLTAKMTPAQSTDYVRFVAEDPSVASVTLEGIVTGLSKGTTEIKAIASSGKQAVCSVSVIDPEENNP